MRKLIAALLAGSTLVCSAEPIHISGIYPHLNMYNMEGECGTFTIEVDLDGTDLWATCDNVTLKTNKPQTYVFPERFSAYWVRLVSDGDTKATAWFTYE